MGLRPHRGDFLEPEADAPRLPGPIPRPEARLAYVAITRARHHLDIGGLAWFKRHHPQGFNTGRQQEAGGRHTGTPPPPLTSLLSREGSSPQRRTPGTV
ncbi:hypothetical protein [Streptomyces longisporoflavus]|uniref:DNA helicase n=1 Tax=Streptomyces longisporoflavus TaxID=28044 RepID=A0ABW7R2E2_9ACTN